ncbi:TadE/TadG family type IV pilus assembly protein [Acetobacter conturbans]|uniref:Pilus assembly protein n=1 Tax=Acetobacter conturbans TaxID=1737472 RepID=A0ABX0K1C3_9PROT|nr:TadE/TadG family type IV pilus assembly protein [Acetobacter conturbans]NHN88498.1 pilus assembly protein [Acetobacter conturbans]
MNSTSDPSGDVNVSFRCASLCAPVQGAEQFPERRFLSDERGVVIVEFALLILPLTAMILASLIMSIVYFTQSALDAVSDQMSREILTGQAPAAGDAGEFKSTACSLLPSYMSCSNLLINVQSVSSLADANIATPQITVGASGEVSASTNYDPGTAESVVVMQLMYALPVLRSVGGFTAATLTNGSRLIVSTSVIKVEPSS